MSLRYAFLSSPSGTLLFAMEELLVEDDSVSSAETPELVEPLDTRLFMFVEDAVDDELPVLEPSAVGSKDVIDRGITILLIINFRYTQAAISTLQKIVIYQVTIKLFS